MNRTLLQRVGIDRPSVDRTSPGRRNGREGDAGYRHSATGHGSRMPSQRASTRLQRPY